VFIPQDRERIRSELLDAARADARLSGGAITGSAAAGREDAWSDIDLAFGVAEGMHMPEVLADWTSRMVDRYHAVDHLDVVHGAWVYRVFLLASTLQVDLAFAPSAEFGARAPTFRLVFGNAADLTHAAPLRAEGLIGYAWLYALHVRSALARGRLWQAEYMVSAVRDHVLALACRRLGLPEREGRGMDQLPKDVMSALEPALVGRLATADIERAFKVATEALITEVERVDRALAGRLAPTLRELSGQRTD